MQKDNLSSPTVKRYDIKTAQVEYKIKGDFLQGHKTLLFTDWGMHESDIEQTDGTATKSITLSDADFDYAFGTGDKDGMKSTVEHAKEWHSDSGLDYAQWFTKNMIAQGFESSGTRVVAGKTCDVLKHVINPMTMCVWKGIPLYMETFTPDKKQKSILEAVTVDESPTVAKDAFTVPANIEFR